YFCWKFGVIPWICESTSGSNQLRLDGSLFYNPSLLTGSGASYTAVAYTTSQIAANVSDITFSRWAVCFGYGCAGASEASAMVGACSRSISGTIPSTGATADGSIFGQHRHG